MTDRSIRHYRLPLVRQAGRKFHCCCSQRDRAASTCKMATSPMHHDVPPQVPKVPDQSLRRLEVVRPPVDTRGRCIVGVDGVERKQL